MGNTEYEKRIAELFAKTERELVVAGAIFPPNAKLDIAAIKIAIQYQAGLNGKR
jgi:hypothetical protein